LREIAERDPRSLMRESLSDLPTDTARGAGDQSDFAVKFHCQN
jgi:hypothetical protein